MVTASTEQIQEEQVHSSLDQLYALRHTALSGQPASASHSV